MCGGRGSRLRAGEKPLVEVGGEPMVDRVLAALELSQLETIYAVTAPQAPRTAVHLDGRVRSIEGTGDGYVDDLGRALEDPRIEPPTLTVVSDLPLLADEHVDRTLDHHGSGAVTVCVPTALKRALGVSVDATDGELSPTGLNVVDDREETVRVSYDARLAVNVNRPEDLSVAEELADGPE